MMKIGFLFNHDQIHQIGHSLPIAFALARVAGPDVHVVVATTNERLKREVERMARLLGSAPVSFVELRATSSASRAAVRMLEWCIPAAKLAVYRDNLPFFRSLDALVVAEKTSLILKNRYGLNGLKIIHTRHGAGDRAIGFNKASARFDRVLVSGRKIRDRLISDAALDPSSLLMVGYPKFDLVPRAPKRLPIQSNGNPTVLYNPHVSPHLSSWYKDGRAVLDYFVEHPELNLIFAPHVMLFERPFVLTIDKLRIDRPGSIDEKYRNAPNIVIDLGSTASTDMTYTLAADLYLGDVSSQVYEFLRHPRPCLFLNSHSVEYRDNPNYRHWTAGRVINDTAELGEGLCAAFRDHSAYLPAQRQLFEESFDITDVPSSQRAASAILDYFGFSRMDSQASGGQAAPNPERMRDVA
jgi:hypothetical protein